VEIRTVEEDLKKTVCFSVLKNLKQSGIGPYISLFKCTGNNTLSKYTLVGITIQNFDSMH